MSDSLMLPDIRYEGHGLPPSAAGLYSIADRQRKGGQPWLREVEQMRFNRLLHLTAFSGKAHREISCIWSSHHQDAGCRCAFPSYAQTDFSSYLPL